MNFNVGEPRWMAEQFSFDAGAGIAEPGGGVKRGISLEFIHSHK